MFLLNILELEEPVPATMSGLNAPVISAAQNHGVASEAVGIQGFLNLTLTCQQLVSCSVSLFGCVLHF